MFTGLVVGTGTLRARERRGPGFRLTIGSGFEALELGESIAVNGACLTVVSASGGVFDADVSLETVEKTTLGAVPLGAALNLERSLQVGQRLGGHWVSGHVDGVARVVSVLPQGEAWLVTIAFPPELRRLIAAKGSVALDGVSLTVNTVDGNELTVMLIPHTRQVTNLSELAAGTRLNLEVDLLARYVVNALEATREGGAGAADERLKLALERGGYQ